MAGGKGIRWARGLFRLWLVMSLMWTGMILALERPDKAFRTLMSDKERAAEIAANLEAQLQGADLDLEISAYAATARASRDRETPTGPSERSQEHEPDDAPSLETIRPTMEAAALKRAVVMRAQIRLLEDEAEEGLQRLQTTVWLVMLPPAFLFIFGATLLWAFWGFRRDQ